MSNVINAQLRSIACPRCGAAVGEQCDAHFGPVTPASLWCHMERWKVRPAGERQHLGYSKEHYYRLGTTPSTKCIHGSHAKCSGKLRVNHGTTHNCSCQCHTKRRPHASERLR
jgi:hypothetical protein